MWRVGVQEDPACPSRPIKRAQPAHWDPYLLGARLGHSSSRKGGIQTSLLWWGVGGDPTQQT